MHRYAAFLLPFVAGFLFSKSVYADPPPLEALAGQNKTVDSSVFPITNSPFPAILFANGGTITTTPPLTLEVGIPTTGLAATGNGSNIAADNVTLTPLTGTPGASTGASVDSGGTISISNSILNVTGLGLGVGTGSLNATNVNIVLMGPRQTTQIGAAIINAGTLTLSGGSITNVTAGGGGDQSIGLRAENGATLIADGTNIGAGFNKSAEATTGGHIVLSNLTITQNFDEGGVEHGALEVSGGSTISGDNIHITTSQVNELGAFAQGGMITLNNTAITTSGESGTGIHSETATFGPEEGRQSTITANNTTVTTSGADAIGAFAIFGGIVNLNGSKVITTGPPHFNTDGATGVYSLLGSTINVTGSTVTTKEASAAQVDDASVMNITNSTLNGGTNGIRISDDDHTLGPDIVAVSNSTVNATAALENQAAIRVDGAEANITLNNTTDNPGTQNLFLNVISVDKAGNPFNSLVNLTASSSTLNGDILVDAKSTANVFLEHSSTLNGAVNENQLTGATGINPNPGTPQVNPLIFPGPLPLSVNLGIDSTSTWNMRASSTINTLAVNPQAHINFPVPPAPGSFKTLLINNLTGTGGIFGMNVDLGLIQGDLIEILTKSEGRHLLTFVNRNQGSDLPVNSALLVVRTADGGAGFRGETDGGTFKYFVVHGDGSPVTPFKNDWYLVRGDEIKPPETTEPPPTNPNPTPAPTPKPTPPQFTPGDNLPLPPEPPPAPLSPAADLTNTANAGRYADPGRADGRIALRYRGGTRSGSSQSSGSWKKSCRVKTDCRNPGTAAKKRVGCLDQRIRQWHANQ